MGKTRAVKGPPKRAWSSLDDIYIYESDLDTSVQCAQRRPAILDSLIAAREDNQDTKVYHLVKKFSNKLKPPPSNLTSEDDDGNLLKSPKDKAETWGSFLRKKFASTPEEVKRPPMPPLSTARTHDDIFVRTEFDHALNRLNNAKATGPDEIPVEVYKKCPQLADELLKFAEFV